MKSDLQFGFLVNKEKNTLTVKREFAANRQLVWDAHTKSELLSQWFAPKPLIAKTKSMDFSEGGSWIYAMVEPNGTEHCGRMDYEKIKPIDFYTGEDSFCDENGNINQELPSSYLNVSFRDLGENTQVETVITYKSLADIETVVKMGMEQGMQSTYERLDDLLIELKNR